MIALLPFLAPDGAAMPARPAPDAADTENAVNALVDFLTQVGAGLLLFLPSLLLVAVVGGGWLGLVMVWRLSRWWWWCVWLR